jgi:hypothetical protein
MAGVKGPLADKTSANGEFPWALAEMVCSPCGTSAISKKKATNQAINLYFFIELHSWLNYSIVSHPIDAFWFFGIFRSQGTMWWCPSKWLALIKETY